jgi:chromosomal replication initiation ATPase DnaA
MMGFQDNQKALFSYQVDLEKQIKAKLAGADRDIAGRREARRKIPFEKVIASVESVLGCPVRMESRGGAGRDMVMLLARNHCGMSLLEIGATMGNIDYGTVHMSIRRLLAKIEKEKNLRRIVTESEVDC